MVSRNGFFTQPLFRGKCPKWQRRVPASSFTKAKPMQGKLPLPTLPDQLIEKGYKSVPYRNLWEAAIDRCIPAVRAKNGRWYYDPEDVPKIAFTFGLNS